MTRRTLFIFLSSFAFTFAACAGGKPPVLLVTSTDVPATALATAVLDLTATPAAGVPPTLTEGSSPATPTATLALDAWMGMPVVPENVSARVQEIYLRGQGLGNNPAAFSKIGDCDATTTWFLGEFEGENYSLGEYQYLQGVIAYFRGSYSRESIAVQRGFTAASVLTPLWADPEQCQTGETPLGCEVRLHRPAYALILLGTNDVNRPEVFERNMRQVLDTLIDEGVVPILATKADNLEGDHSINVTIARLAYEYQLPLWNFWLAVQPLPNHGLQDDGAHLTFAGNHFEDPVRMRAAWPWRNLTALQVLDKIWRETQPTP
ncbi:MAG: SGNH/GDSL hydrolase family protein [Anaerolineales bacterium]|nr:SGNH/GDSL hydrolase family protein [Anaerolineales bacterium]